MLARMEECYCYWCCPSTAIATATVTAACFDVATMPPPTPTHVIEGLELQSCKDIDKQPYAKAHNRDGGQQTTCKANLLFTAPRNNM